MSSYEFKTIIGEDLDVKVFFDYQPAEPANYPHEQNGYPGCDAEIQNMSVMAGKLEWGGKEITDCLNEQWLSRLEIECFEHVNNAT